MDYAEFQRIKKAERRASRDAVKAFVEGARTGNLELFCSGLELVEKYCVFKSAFRAVAKYSAPMEFRNRFSGVWQLDGDHIRSEVNEDRTLIEGLRVLLPPYTGDALQLYRGDSMWNRQRRSYGLSWTTELEVARGFADGIWRTYEGGSVVLSTLAPALAIISAPGVNHERFGAEKEYLVARRRLTSVEVIERFSQLSSEEARHRSINPEPPDNVEMVGWD
jgi:hypothetical protein